MSLYSSATSLRAEVADQVRVMWERREEKTAPAELLARTIEDLWRVIAPVVVSQGWTRPRLRRWMKIVLHLVLEPMTEEKLQKWATRMNEMLKARYGSDAAATRVLEEIDHHLRTREDQREVWELVRPRGSDGKGIDGPLAGLWSHPQIISDLCDDLSRWRQEDADAQRRAKGLKGFHRPQSRGDETPPPAAA